MLVPLLVHSHTHPSQSNWLEAGRWKQAKTGEGGTADMEGKGNGGEGVGPKMKHHGGGDG
jgi:hypothetical protein